MKLGASIFVIALFDVPTVDLGENPSVRSDGHVEEQPCLSSVAAGPWPDEVGQVGEEAEEASGDELGVVTGARGAYPPPPYQRPKVFPPFPPYPPPEFRRYPPWKLNATQPPAPIFHKKKSRSIG